MLFKDLILRFRRDLELGYKNYGQGVHDRGDIGILTRFLGELHDNAFRYSRTTSHNSVSQRGIRYVRLRAHLGTNKKELVSRARNNPIVEDYLDRNATAGVMEASVSDFGIGIVDHFLSSQHGQIYRSHDRRELLERLVHSSLSSSIDPAAGHGLPNVLDAARDIHALVSLRTGEFWLSQSFLKSEAAKRLEDVPSAGGKRAMVAGTHCVPGLDTGPAASIRCSNNVGFRAFKRSLAVALESGTSLSGVMEQIYRFDAARLALADALIVRAPVEKPIKPELLKKAKSIEFRRLPEELLPLRNTEDAFLRFPERPVYLLYSHDYCHYLSKNLNPGAKFDPLSKTEAMRRGAIECTKNAEFDWLVASSHALLPPIGGMLYRAPSNDLVPSFLRIGNVQRSQSALDAIFFWLLPHLSECSAIMAEIWSIGSIALNASRRLASYRSGRQRPCPVGYA